MPFSIVSWNVSPNRVWYVRVSDNGSNILVGLFLTESDARGNSNRQAYGTTSAFGSDLSVSLTNEITATEPVSKFQSSESWHVKVSGDDGDSTKIFKVKEFVELDEIEDPIYRNADLITTRATAEIDAHTYAKITKSLALGVLLELVDVGDTVQCSSTRRNNNSVVQVEEHRIYFMTNESKTVMMSTLNVAGYLALKR